MIRRVLRSCWWWRWIDASRPRADTLPCRPPCTRTQPYFRLHACSPVFHTMDDRSHALCRTVPCLAAPCPGRRGHAARGESLRFQPSGARRHAWGEICRRTGGHRRGRRGRPRLGLRRIVVPRQRQLDIPETFSSLGWEDCLARMEALVRTCLESPTLGPVLRQGDAVALGFVDGDLSIAWQR